MASAHSITSWTRSFLSGLFFLALVSRTLALNIAYCSSENTGSALNAVYNQYQSNGACHDTCKGSYSIAILLGAQCWCSNYAPGVTVSTNDCNSPCPGFGSDWCGDTSAGYYAYFLIDGATPLGTIGASTSTAAASSSSSSPVSITPSRARTSILSTSRAGSTSPSATATIQSSSVVLSVVVPVATPTQTSTVPVPSSNTASSSSSTSFLSPTSTLTSTSSVAVATTTSQSSSSSSRSSAASSPATTSQMPTEVSTIVTTVTGQVRTVLVTPTSPTDSTLGSSSSAGGGGGVSPGKVVGIVLGAALGIGLLIGLGVWYCLRKRHQKNIHALAVESGSASNLNNGIPSRQVSQMSSAGLLGKTSRIHTVGLPASNGPKSAQSSQFNRQSLGTDQRLNPYAIYAQEESRHSNVSLQDNHDYSRQLRASISKNGY